MLPRQESGVGDRLLAPTLRRQIFALLLTIAAGKSVQNGFEQSRSVAKIVEELYLPQLLQTVRQVFLASTGNKISLSAEWGL